MNKAHVRHKPQKCPFHTERRSFEKRKGSADVRCRARQSATAASAPLQSALARAHAHKTAARARARRCRVATVSMHGWHLAAAAVMPSMAHSPLPLPPTPPKGVEIHGKAAQVDIQLHSSRRLKERLENGTVEWVCDMTHTRVEAYPAETCGQKAAGIAKVVLVDMIPSTCFDDAGDFLAGSEPCTPACGVLPAPHLTFSSLHHPAHTLPLRIGRRRQFPGLCGRGDLQGPTQRVVHALRRHIPLLLGEDTHQAFCTTDIVPATAAAKVQRTARAVCVDEAALVAVDVVATALHRCDASLDSGCP